MSDRREIEWEVVGESPPDVVREWFEPLRRIVELRGGFTRPSYSPKSTTCQDQKGEPEDHTSGPD